MPYKVTINTQKYKNMRCSQTNWEPGTINNYMKAINGWSVRESSINDLKWRLRYIHHGKYAGLSLEDIQNTEVMKRYDAWIEKFKKKNNITFLDELCGFNRTIPTTIYGTPQGYVNIEKVIEELKEYGRVDLSFSRFYDGRQYKKNMDGCFIRIEKV